VSVFSRMAAENRDEENLILWRGQHVFVVMNLYPYNNGHLMIIPYRDVRNFTDLTVEEQQEMTRAVDQCIRWLDSALKPDGFNVGMNIGVAGGAGIPKHLHVHVVPRWSADTNFMAATANTKVIPEALSDTYEKLKSAISSTDGRPVRLSRQK
jgi:ATP adenylyltransferase